MAMNILTELIQSRSQAAESRAKLTLAPKYAQLQQAREAYRAQEIAFKNEVRSGVEAERTFIEEIAQDAIRLYVEEDTDSMLLTAFQTMIGRLCQMRSLNLENEQVEILQNLTYQVVADLMPDVKRKELERLERLFKPQVEQEEDESDEAKKNFSQMNLE